MEKMDKNDVVYERCAGISVDLLRKSGLRPPGIFPVPDVHKRQITVCLRTGRKTQVREYVTFTGDLFEMADWLKDNHVEMVAMESTGSYWKPLYNVFEQEGIPAMIVNAQHMRNVPGRKTDVSDAEWIAKLLSQGLLKASFIPDRELSTFSLREKSNASRLPGLLAGTQLSTFSLREKSNASRLPGLLAGTQRELRELTRFRKSQIEERSRNLNRLQKMLDGANIKLSGSIADIAGKTTTALLELVISSEDFSVDDVADCMKGPVKASANELHRAQHICLRQMCPSGGGLLAATY